MSQFKGASSNNNRDQMYPNSGALSASNTDYNQYAQHQQLEQHVFPQNTNPVSIAKSDSITNSNIWHTNPDNQAKIARALKTGESGMNDYIRADEIKKSFH